MKYKIGDVANLLGITPEAIRHYEEIGIITPTKAKNSGYRYYDVWDIHILIRARTYRKYGYSLAETAELLNHYEISDILSNLSEKEADIEKEITWHLNYLKLIRQMQSTVSDAYASQGKYRLEYRPSMYRISAQNGYNLHNDDNNRTMYQSWIKKVPFVFPSALFQQSSFENGNEEFSFGLCIDEEFAGLLDIRKTDDIDLFPSCLCVYTTLMSSSETILSPQKLSPAINYIHNQGMKLGGDVISKVVLMNKKEEEYFSLHQIWLPIF